MLGRAIEIVSSEFSKEVDKSGRPYVLHCIWVMNKVRHLGDDYMISAILHDLIEDTHWTKEMLVEEGFSEEIVCAVELLTHKEGESYDTYIQKLSSNEIAKQVKIRDLEHNSKITRLKGLRTKDIKRLHKYHEAYTYLIN